MKELNSVFKKNMFIDHRLGENDPTLTSDEKLMQRLIAERTVRLTYLIIRVISFFSL